jgi:ABC-type phosphate/phosphonate transport system substrate-binding protein
MTVASLPMYDLPELRLATDDWWQGLRQAMVAEGIGEVPVAPGRAADDEAFWRRKDLLLSQTCGYPLMTDYCDDLMLLGTPHYDVPGCDGDRYSSWIIVAAESPATSLEDLRGSTCVVNAWTSHSGMNALRHRIAPLANGGAFFDQVVISGGHRNSVQMVAEGKGDVAAIDCVTWALIVDVAPVELSGVRILDQTAMVPGLPYVTTAGRDDDEKARLVAALKQAFVDPDLEDVRGVLRLDGFSATSMTEYDVILWMKNDAAKRGYPFLK